MGLTQVSLGECCATILAELSASAAAADAEASPIAMEEDAAIPDITTASVADASSSPDPNEGDDSSMGEQRNLQWETHCPETLFWTMQIKA